MVGWLSNVSLGGKHLVVFVSHTFLLEPPLHFTFSFPSVFHQFFKQLPPLPYHSHQISHIINRKCELGNLMSHKVKKTNILLLFQN